MGKYGGILYTVVLSPGVKIKTLYLQDVWGPIVALGKFHRRAWKTSFNVSYLL